MKSHILIISASLLLVSCQSYDHGKGLTVLGATTAGALAWKLTEGKSPTERLMWTAASAGGAYALGEHVRSKVKESEKKHYEEGYKLGLADASKMQYEIIQNRQKEDSPRQQARYFLYEFPGVKSRDGVNFAPHSVKLRVQED